MIQEEQQGQEKHLHEASRLITLSTVQITTSFPIHHQAFHLRGFFGNRFPELSLLHNHYANGSHIQIYPLVQYKILGTKAYLVGINEGAELLPLLIENLHVITLGSTKYPIISRETTTRTMAVGVTRRMMYYQFISPWLALNPTNYRKYRTLNGWKERKDLVNRILIGNCLSLAKNLGIRIPFRLFAHTHLDAVDVTFKENDLMGFVGRFKVNFQLPDLLGIGKGVSRGFGTVLSMPHQKLQDEFSNVSKQINDSLLETPLISSSL